MPLIPHVCYKFKNNKKNINNNDNYNYNNDI